MKGNEPGRRNPQESIIGKITRENKRKQKKKTFPSNLVFHLLLSASHSPAVTLSLLGPVETCQLVHLLGSGRSYRHGSAKMSSDSQVTEQWVQLALTQMTCVSRFLATPPASVHPLRQPSQPLRASLRSWVAKTDPLLSTTPRCSTCRQVKPH